MVILRCRNCDEANKKIYIKQICDASTCRMTMIRRALDSPMSKDLPRYLERCRRPHRKFSRNTWKKSSSSKHEILSEYWSLTLSFIFQNLNFFEFSWHIFRLVRRMVTIFYWRTEQDPGHLSNSSNMSINLTEKFRSLWEKILAQKV